MDEGLTVTQFAYDYQGARILRRDDDGTRTRYFFQGLTEEVVKESVATSPSDDDFIFAVRENGDVADDWAVYSASPAGAQVTSVNDATRHPNLLGDVPSGRVIYCDGGNGNGFAVGDKDGSNYNPNGNSWNDTRRVLSFWFKGGFSPVYVCVSTSAGSRFLMYYTSGGTDFVDGSGNVNVYLGWSAGGTTWRRFERDIAADWARVTGGASTWQNTDGLLIRPTSHASYDIWFDDLRLSNARTVTHNSLTGGAIGQIASSREVTSAGGNGSLGLTDTWYHYDHIGNVMNFSNSSGALVAGSIQHQDAWGNVLSSSTTGAWATMTDGRHLTTKEYDADAGMYYFWNRWYESADAVFVARTPLPGYAEHGYRLSGGNSIAFYDPDGLASMPITWWPPMGGVPMPTNPVPGTLCSPIHQFTWGSWRYATAFQHPGYPGGMMPTSICPIMQVCVPIAVVGGGGGAVTYLQCKANTLNCEAKEQMNKTGDDEWSFCNHKCKGEESTGTGYSLCMESCLSAAGF